MPIYENTDLHFGELLGNIILYYAKLLYRYNVYNTYFWMAENQYSILSSLHVLSYLHFVKYKYKSVKFQKTRYCTITTDL